MNEQKKMLLTVAVFGLIAIGLLVVLYLQMGHIGIGPFQGPESLTTRIEQQQQRLKEAQSKIDQIPDREKELQNLTRIQKKVDQLLPKESTPEQLLLYIQKKAEESGVTPLDIKPAKSRGTARVGGRGRGASQQLYEEWTYEMQLLGTYDQLGRFINLIEEFQITAPGGQPEERFFNVKELEISADSGGITEGGRHECKLVIQTFRYTGQDAPAKRGK